MKLKEKTTIINVCIFLQSNLLKHTELLTEFILKNYGDTIYSILSIENKNPYRCKVKLQDDKLGDFIQITRINHIEKNGKEELEIYHLSENNHAEATYSFYFIPDKDEIIYQDTEIFENNGVRLKKSNFVLINKNEVIEEQTTQSKEKINKTKKHRYQETHVHISLSKKRTKSRR